MKALWMVLASLGLAACASTGTGSAEGNRSLAGSWRLTEVATQSVPMTGGSAKLLQFEAATNKVSGNVGCNRLFGEYQSEGERLSFNGIATTRMACDPISMQMETNVVQNMEKVQTWSINGSELQLKDQAGQTILKFKRL